MKPRLDAVGASVPALDDLAHLETRLRDAFLEVLEEVGPAAAGRFETFAARSSHPSSLTAAPGVGPSTSMVAVYPTDEQAAAMAQPGGEDSAVLHVTLAFLGDLPPDRAALAASVVRRVAAVGRPLSGVVGGAGLFGDNGKGHPSILMPDVVGLAELRHAVTTALCDAGVHFVGCDHELADGENQRHGWTPHMTIAYEDEPRTPPPYLLGRPLDFGQLTFSQGDVRRDFDFGRASEPGSIYSGFAPITRHELEQHDDDRFLQSLTEEMKRPYPRRTADERAWLATGRTIPVLGVPNGFALTAGAVVAETDKGIEIGKVAARHQPEGGDYGDTAWNEVDRLVVWVSADWTSIEEADAAIADFLAIDGVDEVEECAECPLPSGDGWEKVYTHADPEPPADETDAVVAAGTPGWTQPHPDELVDVDSLVSKFRGKADPVRRQVVEDSASPPLEQAGLAFDATNPFVSAVVGKTGRHITYIADTTRLNVMRIVRRSYEEGLSIPDTAKAIREGMAAASTARATLIARTEMTSLVNGGSLAAMNVVNDAGVGNYLKSWLTAPGATYPRHEDYPGLDGQTTELNGVFDVGGVSLAYPGDPDGPPDEVCNCRCTLIYTESGQEVGQEDADSAGSFDPSALGAEDAAVEGEAGADEEVAPVEDATGIPDASSSVVTGEEATVDVANAAAPAVVDTAMIDRSVLPPPAPELERPAGDHFSAPTAPFLPATAIEKIESLGLDGWPPAKGRLAKRIFGDAADTVELYKHDGVWEEQRLEIQQNVVNQHFAGKTPSGHKDAYFTSGGGASGKGGATFLVDGQETTLEQLGARSDTIWVDPDRIKAMLPEYQELLAGGDPFAASGVHEESSQLAKAIVQKALDDGYRVIVDTTGSSDGFVAKIEKAASMGYSSQVTMFSIPTNEAIMRSLSRGDKRGRYVAIKPMKQAHQGASAQLAKWSVSGDVGEWRLFDNSGAAPELVARGGHGDVEVLDPVKWAAILAKASE